MTRRAAFVAALALALAACSGQAPSGDPDPDPDPNRRDAGTEPDAPVSLDPTPGTYRETCDGSGAIALDLQHFLDVNDENQGARVFRRGADAAPAQTLDVSAALGLTTADEGDLEDVARIGARLYIISSHGRNSSGQIRQARYRFGAMDVSGKPPQIALAPAGSTQTLLQAMLVAGNWDAPDAAIIAALDAASKLGDASDPDLAPELSGTNIEGLAARGTELLIGFRNPRPSARAIVVRLTNPAAVITGAAPRFGGATTLDLGGLGIRGMAWSEAHGAVLVLAGPHDASAGPFRLYKWSGTAGEAPALAATITAPALSAPEAVVPYPGTKDVQIVFDQGDALIGGVSCKTAAAAQRRFVDTILRLD
ncbi:MAG TPA: DUF3616 domain-containing protein [Kofleriaceae bacterium]|nr:DUF3616 domain-containing protein [Kofleriaceae bacterium]